MSGTATSISASAPSVPVAVDPIRRLAIDPNVAGDNFSEEDAFVERLVMWASAKFGFEQLVTAKEEHFWKTGKAFPDDTFYHLRMAHFLDYFLFQRPLDRGSTLHVGKTPFTVYQEEAPPCRPGWELEGYCHSLFEVVKISRHGLIVEDVLAGARLSVSRKSGERHDGFKRKDLVQGFLYGMGSRFVLSRGLLFHPERAAGTIKKQVKKAKKSDDFDHNKVLSRLARQQIRHLRHPHVDARLIYSQEPR